MSDAERMLQEARDKLLPERVDHWWDLVTEDTDLEPLLRQAGRLAGFSEFPPQFLPILRRVYTWEGFFKAHVGHHENPLGRIARHVVQAMEDVRERQRNA